MPDDAPQIAYAIGIKLPGPDGVEHFRALIYSDKTWMEAIRTVDRWALDPEIDLPRSVADFFVKRIVQEVTNGESEDYGEIEPEL